MPNRTRRAARSLVPLVLSFAVAACSSTGAGSLPDDPVRALAAVEATLLEARSVRCFSELVAEGALSADLRSEHQLEPDGRTRVRVKGAIAGRAVDVVFESDGATMGLSGLGAGDARESAAAPDLFAGQILGFTRMGWMHNVSQLAGGGFPEGVDGGVREWVAARNVRFGDEFELNGVPARPLLFDVEVDGAVRAQAVLWVALESGLPLLRLQRVQLSGGEMRVSEFYENLEINGRMEW
jgi:hypothetical protein